MLSLILGGHNLFTRLHHVPHVLIRYVERGCLRLLVQLRAQHDRVPILIHLIIWGSLSTELGVLIIRTLCVIIDASRRILIA